MQALTTSELGVLAVCLMLGGLIFGMIICLVVMRLVFPGVATSPRKHVSLSSQEDLRRTLAVLQQLQVIVGYEAATQNPGLRDLVDVVRMVQRAFGRNASLEAVIQTLVAQDIERQLAERKLQQTSAPQAIPPQQEAVVA